MSGSADCSRLRPYLVDFVVGELSPGEDHRREIEAHLAECAQCRAVAEELRGTGRALEAIRASTPPHLDDQARRALSTKAKIEAEKLRAAGERRREAARGQLFQRVPAYAWLALGLGTAGALALAVFAPRWDLFGDKRPAARVLQVEGANFGKSLAAGAEVSLPPEAILRLELADRSRLDLRGPAEARLAAGNEPLEIRKGRAWLHAGGGGTLRLKLAPLRLFGLESGAQAAIEARPVEDEALVVAVLGGAASYSAAGGDGKLAQGQTLVVELKSGAATVRPSKDTETADWHRKLPAVE